MSKKKMDYGENSVEIYDGNTMLKSKYENKNEMLDKLNGEQCVSLMLGILDRHNEKHRVEQEEETKRYAAYLAAWVQNNSQTIEQIKLKNNFYKDIIQAQADKYLGTEKEESFFRLLKTYEDAFFKIIDNSSKSINDMNPKKTSFFGRIFGKDN